MRIVRCTRYGLVLMLLLAGTGGCGDETEEGRVTIGGACAMGPCREGLQCIVNDIGARVCGKPCTTNADCEGYEVFDYTGYPWTQCQDCPGSPAQCVPAGSTCASTP